ncbi:hypothetical protein [Fibrobacter succinogenes]|uniref:DUF2953 domain-containing protein n=1 Tax=Fibrobacter succinogenes TaxID=833 RepID=A0A380RYR9_FIBSU|nr:hypothetical protein [Fibrobacter succinogenes]PWJ37860.1 hypothetical protein IE02_1360 [Fibrobacter succinogenes subsp. elongatus]SUQ20107.1 hypothetical protein SAMN05661053_1360 [Fibrobacter succinogenes]
MGFLSWLLCVILVVALVLLLFPFAFRIDFEAGERGVRALFFFFKKKVYEYEKKWKENAGSKELAVDSEKLEPQDAPKSVTQDAPPMVEAVAKKPAETPKTEPMKVGIDESAKRESLPPSSSKQSEGDSVKSSASNESAHPVEVKSSSVVEVSSEAKAAESENCDSEKNETPAEDKKPKKEKRKLSDREFWTIILTPDFDARAFKYILKILKAVLSLFRVRFRDCFVEGIRSDYQTMGYIAAANGFLKAYPYVGDWDLRMDWCNEKELRAVGSVHLSITLLRIFCFTLETLVLAGILAFSFWRRRAHVIKTNELPQLGFIRRRILEFILED